MPDRPDHQRSWRKAQQKSKSEQAAKVEHAPKPQQTLRRGFRVLGRGIREEPRTFAIAVAGGAVYGTGTVGAGYLLGQITDSTLVPALEAESLAGVDVLAAGGALAGVALFTSVGVVIRRAAAGKAMYDLQARYRRRVTRQYLRLPLSWHHRHPAGQLLSNANADVEATFQVFAPLPFSISVLIMLVGAAVVMVLADPVLAAIGLTVLPAVLGTNVIYQRKMAPRVTRAQQLRADVSDVAHESFDGALVVKTLGREAMEASRFGSVAGRLREANVDVGRMRGVFDPLIEGLPTLGTLAVLAVGTSRVASGAAEAGDVVQIAYLLTLLAFPVRAIGWVLAELPRTVVGWERVSAVLEAGGGLRHGDGEPQAGGAASLSLQGVHYGFEQQHGPRIDVLHDVTVDVTPGVTVAVVGPTGSGKSSLASLLVRLVDPHDGRVLLDSRDVRDLRPGGVAASASLVPQGTFVFDDTVRGNITLQGTGDEPDVQERADGAYSDEHVWAALRLAQADGFVAALPDGLDTRVGERGATLSGGQRQRLALARALVRRPRLLVMDDATSAVDPRVEAAILAGLRGASSDSDGLGTTVVVVAYRKATIALADEVVYVEHGRVAGRGTHEQLRKSSEGYRHLVNAYQRDAEERAAQRSGPVPVTGDKP